MSEVYQHVNAQGYEHAAFIETELIPRPLQQFRLRVLSPHLTFIHPSNQVCHHCHNNQYACYCAEQQQEQERQALEERTTDKVQPGEQQPESDHFMQTDDSFVGNSNDVFYRDASDGHYFSYLMQTGGQTDLSLRLKYWGVGEWKSHEFDIFVDDVLVTSVNNTGKYRISEFKYETYPIPADALKDKKQVRVKFVAKPKKQIGEIYEVRLVKNS